MMVLPAPGSSASRNLNGWRQHLTVNRRDLVRQGLDLRSRHCDARVEKVSEANAVGFGGEAQQRSVRVEAVGPAQAGDLEGGLFARVHEALGDLAVGPKHQIERVRPEPSHLLDFREA
jgi:hypothetical protein